MNDKLTITLNIAGRPCVLTIEREEEEEIRKAAQLINSKIAKYREKYATADPVDFSSCYCVTIHGKDAGG